MSLLCGIMSRCCRSHQSLGVAIRVTGDVMNKNSPQQQFKPSLVVASRMATPPTTTTIRPFGHKSYGRRTPKLEKQRKKLVNEPYLSALRDRLATDHGIVLTSLLAPQRTKGVPLSEKWAKKGWKCALACHKLEQGQDCTELMKDQQFARRVEKQSVAKKLPTTTTAAEKRQRRGSIEQSHAKVYLKWITKALKARGEFTEGTMGELQTRLQVSVLGEEERAKCDEINRIKMEELLLLQGGKKKKNR